MLRKSWRGHKRRWRSTKKLTEISNKAMEENNVLLKRILAINNASSTWALLVAAGSLSKGSAGDFVYVVTYVAGGWQLFIISYDVNVNWDETSSSNVMSSELCEPSLELLIKLLVIGILDLLIYGSFWSFQYYLHSVMKSACALVMNYLTFLWRFGNWFCDEFLFTSVTKMRTYHSKPCGPIKIGHVDHPHHWPRQLPRGWTHHLQCGRATWSRHVSCQHGRRHLAA